MQNNTPHRGRWFLFGAILGALLTYLFGTESGKATRKKAKDWFNQ